MKSLPIVAPLLGIILILLGVVALLGFLGSSNPISFVSDTILGLSNQFLSLNASFIFWCVIIIFGVSLLTPKQGFTKTIFKRR